MEVAESYPLKFVVAPTAANPLQLEGEAEVDLLNMQIPCCYLPSNISRRTSMNPARAASKLTQPINLQIPLGRSTRGSVRPLVRPGVMHASAVPDLAKQLPIASLVSLLASLGTVGHAAAADFVPPTPAPPQIQQAARSNVANYGPVAVAPAVAWVEENGGDDYLLPEGTNWRYSEFLDAIENDQIDSVRFSKDGEQALLTTYGRRRAVVTLPDDPMLVDLLGKNNVEVSVSDGQSDGNAGALIITTLFPIIAFGCLFLILRKTQQGGGGITSEFGKSRSKFQEEPDTGVTFADVAGCDSAKLELQEIGCDSAKLQLQEIVGFMNPPDK
eukprot:gene32255-16822_t